MWIGVLISSSGQWMEQIAIGWLMLELTDSAFMVGAAMGAKSLPSLILSPFAGAYADRLNRVRVIGVTQLASAVLAATMAFLNFTEMIEPWHVLTIVLIFGVSWAFNNPARHALMPSLVPREALMNAIAVNSSAFNISRVFGPAVAGVLISTIDIWGAFFVAAVLYLLVFISTFFIRAPHGALRATQESVAENLRVAGRYLRENRTVLSIIAMVLIPALVGSPYIALMPVLVRDVLGQDETGLALIYVFTGLGAMFFTLGLASRGNYRGAGKLVFAMALVFGLSLMALGAVTSFPVVLLISTIGGGCFMVYMAVTTTLIQTIVPNEIRGRVMSIMMMEFGLTPLGALFMGYIADTWSVTTALFIMGALMTIGFATAFVLFPSVRRLDPGGRASERAALGESSDPAPSAVLPR